MAAHGVRLADAGAQALGDRAQHLVADRMAQRVVDVLEPVAIEEQHREAPAIAARQRDRTREAIVQQQAVRQVSERVVLGKVQHLQTPLAGHDDVAEDNNGAKDVALAIVNRRGRVFDGRLVAIAPDQDVVALQTDFLVVLDRQAGRILRVLPGQPIRHVEDLCQRSRECFRSGPAGQSLGLGIEIGDVALRVGRHHRVADRVQRHLCPFELYEFLFVARSALEHHRDQLDQAQRVDMLSDDAFSGSGIECTPGQRLVGRRREQHDCDFRGGATQLVHCGEVAAFGQRQVEQHSAEFLSAQSLDAVLHCRHVLDLQDFARGVQHLPDRALILSNFFDQQHPWHAGIRHPASH